MVLNMCAQNICTTARYVHLCTTAIIVIIFNSPFLLPSYMTIAKEAHVRMITRFPVRLPVESVMNTMCGLL